MNRSRYYQLKRRTVPYLFVLPSMITILVFCIFPMFRSLYLSLTHYDIISPEQSTFIGLENYVRMFTQDPYVANALINTVIFSFSTTLIGLVLSLAISLILCDVFYRVQKAVRSVLFLPVIMSMTIAGLIWSLIYHPSVGILNYFMNFLGFPDRSWLGEPGSAMCCLIATAVWKDLGYNITIWSAGILSLSMEYREAARIDGASWWAEFWRVRMPLLKPVAAILSILSLSNTFQNFDLIYVMTEGGPINSTQVIVYYLWKVAFRDYDMGYASAIGWVLFVILAVFSLLQLKMYGKENV